MNDNNDESGLDVSESAVYEAGVEITNEPLIAAKVINPAFHRLPATFLVLTWKLQ